jgi:hypothetical protein
MKSPIDHIAAHAALGEQIVQLVKEAGLLKKARRAKKASKPRAKKAAPKTAKRVIPAATPAAS